MQSASATVHVADVGDGPNCGTAHANPDVLWPPNRKLVSVRVVDVATNGLPTTITTTGVSQDEPTGAGGDAVIAADGALVRADRLGQGNGRVYHVGFTAANAQGSCSGTVTACVPHANGQGCVDGGALFSSLAH